MTVVSNTPTPFLPGNYALRYARALSWRVVPGYWLNNTGTCVCKDPACKEPGAHPLVERWDKYATNSQGEILEWWKFYPQASVLMVPSGFMGISVPALWGETARHEHKAVFENVPTIDGRGWLTFLTLLQEDNDLKPLAEVQQQYQARGANVRVLDVQDYVPVPPSCKGTSREYVWLEAPFGTDAEGMPTRHPLRGAGAVVTALVEVAGLVWGEWPASSAPRPGL